MSNTDADIANVDAEIDAWVEKTKALTGKVCQERKPWNNDVSADAIQHFAFGTSDSNPLWTDPDYAARSPLASCRRRQPSWSRTSIRSCTARR